MTANAPMFPASAPVASPCPSGTQGEAIDLRHAIPRGAAASALYGLPSDAITDPDIELLRLIKEAHELIGIADQLTECTSDMLGDNPEYEERWQRAEPYYAKAWVLVAIARDTPARTVGGLKAKVELALATVVDYDLNRGDELAHAALRDFVALVR